MDDTEFVRYHCLAELGCGFAGYTSYKSITENGLVELNNWFTRGCLISSEQTVDIILKKKLDFGHVMDQEPHIRYIYITVSDGVNKVSIFFVSKRSLHLLRLIYITVSDGVNKVSIFFVSKRSLHLLRLIYITVSDGVNKVTAVLRLYITDVNDEAPIFDPPSYRVTINESQAQDADDVYENTFHINTYTGEITLKNKLDYEKRSFYQFKVRAWDTNFNESKAVHHANESDLVISIRDVQDSPPYFVNLPYLASFKETLTENSSILKVTAYDGDRGIPNDVRYSFTGGPHTNFSINETTGEIAIANKLDADDPDVRKRGGVFKINVTATEVPAPSVTQGGENKTTTVVSITVLDVNDHKPTFSARQYNASVQENTPNGVPITLETVIDVIDGDQGENSKFTIYVEKDGSPYQDFDTLPDMNQPVFSKTSVIIRVNNSNVLDYEKNKTITFQIVARENSTDEHYNNSATVTLTITDVNDNSPQFSNESVHFNVSEDAANDTIIGSVHATDDDSGDYGTVFYELENESGNSQFGICKHNGSIFVKAELDRETKADYSLFVVAWDNEKGTESSRRSGRKKIKISLLDVNDSPPEFSATIPTTEIAEDIPVNTTVLFVSATDRDLGDNRKVEYSIYPDADVSSCFGINSTTGEICVKSPLLEMIGFKNITVVATDKGSPQLNGTQVVRFYIRDVNINPPKFVHPSFDNKTRTAQIDVLEEKHINTTVITLNATDADLGTNGKVVYRILIDSENAWSSFRLNSTTGVLQNAGRLDRETRSNYLVQAEDLGIPQLVSTITLNVTLLDVDDNAPVFKTRQLTLHVDEENNTACVGMVNIATDADEYENHTRICYFIYGGEFVDHFKLNKTSGELCLQTKLDRETKDTVNIVVQALANCSAIVPPSDNYNNSDTSLLKVDVNVDDVNDQPPVFSKKDLTHGILFDTELMKVIYNLQDKVSDADEGDNSITYFRLTDTVPSAEIGASSLAGKPPFVVHQNGTVLTNMLFSSAMLGHFVLKIEAYDIGNLTGDGELKIFIISNIQRVKIVFRGKVPDKVKAIEDDFISELEKALGYIIVVDTVASHQKPDKTYDDKSTDMFIHARYNTTEGGIVPATELWRAFDFTPSVSFIFAKYGVSETAPVVYQSTSDNSTERNLVTGFAIAVIGLAILAIALGVALYMIRGKYVRRLKSYSTMAEVKAQEGTAYPGTNVYACNPVFNKSISIVDVDTSSINSLDDNDVDHGKKTPLDPYAEQEMTMCIFGESCPDVTDSGGYSTLDAVLRRYEQDETGHRTTHMSLSNQNKDEDTDSGTFMPLDVTGLEHSDI
ncbi:cadherin-23-like [Gigantopelta aegis]|uniref:cadherin-23-like n=1 Tax=Gigantopelta aegis TaxID=1735272 RepID=UPI001B88CD56|nr:cadherin-23-like [Gigantopelta aegis]